MRVSISGLCRNAARDPGYKFALGELCDHLKLLRDDPSRHSEFFDLYVFDDDAEYRAKLAEAGQQPATGQVSPDWLENRAAAKSKEAVATDKQHGQLAIAARKVDEIWRRAHKDTFENFKQALVELHSALQQQA